GLTKCLAITGPGTMFPGATPAKLADAGDRADRTFLCVEVANLDVPWTAPIDLDVRTMSRILDDRTRPGLSSPHPAGIGAAQVGRGPWYVTRPIGREELEARLTVPATAN